MKKTISVLVVITIAITTSLKVNAQWQVVGYVPAAHCLTTSGGNIFVGTTNGVYLSSDAGINWDSINTSLINKVYVTALSVSGNNIFIGTNHGVYISPDTGKNWVSVNTGLNDTMVLSLITNGNNIFAGTFNGSVFLSTDNGSNWSSVSNGLMSYSAVNALMVDGNNIFAGTSNGVFLSNNNGASWVSINTGLTDLYVSTLAENGNNIFAGTSSGVFLSTDNGNNWTSVNKGLTDTSINVLIVNKNIVFTATGNGNVFSSINNGSNWSMYSNGLPPSVFIMSLTVSGNYVFAGINYANAIWKRPLSDFSGLDEINSNGTNISVYPIPFTNVINVKVDKEKDVNVSLFDSMGRLIKKTKVNSFVCLKTKDLPSGVYFLEFSSDKKTSMMKITK